MMELRATEKRTCGTAKALLQICLREGALGLWKLRGKKKCSPFFCSLVSHNRISEIPDETKTKAPGDHPGESREQPSPDQAKHHRHPNTCPKTWQWLRSAIYCENCLRFPDLRNSFTAFRNDSFILLGSKAA